MVSVTSRALSLLAAFASPIFLVAAVGGWLYGIWPANLFTLAIAGIVVIGGPILGIVHVATAWERDEESEAETAALPVATLAPRPVRAAAPVPARPPLPLTPKADSARRFAAWRDQPNAAIEQRERARRASQYVRS